eukprot:4747871-Prymnesium_polylepis.2
MVSPACVHTLLLEGHNNRALAPECSSRLRSHFLCAALSPVASPGCRSFIRKLSSTGAPACRTEPPTQPAERYNYL